MKSAGNMMAALLLPADPEEKISGNRAVTWFFLLYIGSNFVDRHLLSLVSYNCNYALCEVF